MTTGLWTSHGDHMPIQANSEHAPMLGPYVANPRGDDRNKLLPSNSTRIP